MPRAVIDGAPGEGTDGAFPVLDPGLLYSTNVNSRTTRGTTAHQWRQPGIGELGLDRSVVKIRQPKKPRQQRSS
jgi:hypothetical protein